MSDNIKSIVFAAVMCVVCSTLLTLASVGLKDFQQKNILLDKQKNILKAVALLESDKSYKEHYVSDLYNKNISEYRVDSDGRLLKASESEGQGLPLYLFKENDEIKAYIIPVESRGLWGKIYGYLAIEKDGSTVAGFTVYKHQETPGLGGEIEKNWFQKNFVGKKIVDTHGDLVSVQIAKGAVDEKMPDEKRSHYVDGISGATLTGKFLTSGLKEILSAYEPVSIKFRKNNPRGLK